MNKPSRARREEIRRTKTELEAGRFSRRLREGGLSLVVAFLFTIIASLILIFRPEVAEHRMGQWVGHDVISRVNFTYPDKDEFDKIRDRARADEPHVFKTDAKPYESLKERLLNLPMRLRGQQFDALDPLMQDILDRATLTRLQEQAEPTHKIAWEESVQGFVAAVKALELVIVPEEQRQQELERTIQLAGGSRIKGSFLFSPEMKSNMAELFESPGRANFPAELRPRLIRYTAETLGATHSLDDTLTTQAANRAADGVLPEVANLQIGRNQKIVSGGVIGERDYRILQAEAIAYNAQQPMGKWSRNGGLIGATALLTLLGSAYIFVYQPRIIRNHNRAAGLSLLLLLTLLITQMAGLTQTPLYLVGVAPTILVTMILAIAYDRRFAAAMGIFHAVLVTLGLLQPVGFFLVACTGILMCCFTLDEVRSRSKLIEVGGLVGMTLIVAAAIAGLLAGDPLPYLLRNALYAGAAGLSMGFIALGILPPIEKWFKITTSMTLLELADFSHPLLRRLAAEAPGTYTHSLSVATLAEEAASVIGGNGLLCRVAAYYHDVGKINKAEYFVENQVAGQNRHLMLNPSVSLLIILGHVKDGVELAKEYNLPSVIQPFIQSHHGTTLVEYFYHQACTRTEAARNAGDPQCAEVDEHQYRYGGPRPRSKEVAILMLADCCESACRAMGEPSGSKIQTLVHELTMKRLVDGQFDECEITLRELEMVQKSLTRTLLGIYHGRIAYPSARTEAMHDMAKTIAVQPPGAASA